MIQALQNPVIVIFLAICTFIGLPSFVYTIYSRHIDKNKRQISIASISNNIVRQGKSTIDKLELSFDGKDIKELSITKIAIWNSGSEEIRREDIASDKQLCIKCRNDAQILDAEIIIESDNTNKFSIVSVENNVVTLDFEYIDRKSGIIVQVAHTGEETDLFVDVKIKGGKPVHDCNLKSFVGKKLNREKSKEYKRNTAKFLACYLCVMVAFFLYITTEAILIVWNTIDKDTLSGSSTISNSITQKIIFTVVLAITAIVLIIATIFFIRKEFKTFIPSSLRKHIE